MTREVCEHFNPVDQPCAKCEEKRKSEALFLADELEIPLGTVIQSEICRRAAKELRRLHAELERCKQVCAATSEGWRSDTDVWKAQRDALRLAVKLEMCIDFMDCRVIAGNLPEVVIDFDDGDYCRAIVRAAADIGRTL